MSRTTSQHHRKMADPSQHSLLNRTCTEPVATAGHLDSHFSRSPHYRLALAAETLLPALQTHAAESSHPLAFRLRASLASTLLCRSHNDIAARHSLRAAWNYCLKEREPAGDWHKMLSAAEESSELEVRAYHPAAFLWDALLLQQQPRIQIRQQLVPIRASIMHAPPTGPCLKVLSFTGASGTQAFLLHNEVGEHPHSAALPTLRLTQCTRALEDKATPSTI